MKFYIEGNLLNYFESHIEAMCTNTNYFLLLNSQLNAKKYRLHEMSDENIISREIFIHVCIY